MSPKPAVLLVVLNRNFGGAERHVLDLAGELVRRGHRVGCVFTVASYVGGNLGPAVVRFPVPGRSPCLVARSLLSAVSSFEPDIVHLHSPRASLLGRLILATTRGRRRGGPPAVVSTAHGWIPQRLALRRLFAAIYLVSARLEDGILAVSCHTAARLGRWGRDPRVVSNGIERGRSLPPIPRGREGVARIGFLGRLTQEKGFALALAACEEAQRRLAGVSLTFHVYGDGPLLSQYRRAAEGGRLAVWFHGWVQPSEVVRTLSGLDILLVTSREEGCPYVILEAMAAGCPVIATDVGGIPDLITSGKTGFLVPGADARGKPSRAKARAAAEAIVTLVQDPALRARIREAAWEEVGAHSLGTMVDGVERVYQTALGRRRHRGGAD